MLNKKWFLGLATMSALTLAACGNGDTADEGATDEEVVETEDGEAFEAPTTGGEGVLDVWTFTDEAATMINDYYLEEFPDLDYEINISEVPTEEFETQLDPVFGTDSAPDVIFAEQAFVKKYVESGMLVDLSQFEGIASGAENTFDYVKEIGTQEDGTFVANSWQTTPGAFFYRQDLASEHLGIESPEDMQAAISDWDGFLNTARDLKEATDGSVYMVSSRGDLNHPYYMSREQGWVVDDTLVIDDQLYELLDTAKTMVDEGLMMDADPQGEEYFAAMNGDEVMGYSLPTWGMHFWLKPNADETAGNWRMVTGPTSYFRGGTWMGITQTSDMQEEAAQLVEWLTTSEDFMRTWAEETGDVVSHEGVVEEVRGDYEEEFLGGQNHYDAFADAIPAIDGSIITEYDQTISGAFDDLALTPYSKGEVTQEEAIEAFKLEVQNLYPNLQVD
ncbi:ABC-type glycerol-3-phosphate transport system, substrate-binding protein [Alkalibacterium putridalgicola]|jgi:ABC-type glycerol-3-phosphate transport system substrate-binding protein|uniref:ABC-type glycerol-3-phosphate transport system, substrate-binding protein n=1 Tax=Alkalibacterium putridalgicola TaxID=426703 RepID=A0A1H7S035_9LACT|nr:ABC transporter substrate-binding protein [Alkalibacterium putridalgicola]GEK88352.1 sugar ABC transporter substrate-binding protein [Alkalibacterium putridalgicola]SEL65941.1 ABC-type glycerol-3-phosphate transport system, substrate-binding protein [Alkalibacterium putridalgicola]